MTAARHREIAARATRILQAAHPEPSGIFCRMRQIEPVALESRKGRWVFVSPTRYAQAAEMGTRGRDAYDYTVLFTVTEALPYELPVVHDDESLEEVLEAWVNERVDWVESEISQRFRNVRTAKELWGTGYETVFPQFGPEMVEFVVSEFIDQKRMFRSELEFVFREI